MMEKVIDFKTNYFDGKALVMYGKYDNGDTALMIADAETYEPLATATVNLAGEGRRPKSGNIFVKDYSENTGMVDALKEAGVITEVVERFSIGMFSSASVAECVLADEFKP